MEREYTNYPKDLPVVTPIGQILVTPTQNDHLYVESEAVIVRGKSIRFTLHFTKRGNTWNHLSDNGRNTIYAGSADSATVPQRAKIVEVITPVLLNWIGTNGDTLKQAQAAHVNNRLLSLESERDELQGKIDKLNSEMEAIKASL